MRAHEYCATFESSHTHSYTPSHKKMDDSTTAFTPTDDGPIGVPAVIERLEFEDLHMFEASEMWSMLAMNGRERELHVKQVTEAFVAAGFDSLQKLFDATPPYCYEPIFAGESRVIEGEIGSCILATYVSPSPMHRGDLMKAAITSLVSELRDGNDTMTELVLVELNSRVVRIIDLKSWTSDERADFVDWLRAEASK
jgi:hypothetical protein